MDWFRFYNEAKDDLKLRRIARETGQSFASVLGIWTLLLCIASASPERGKLLIATDIPVTDEDIADIAGCNVSETLQKLRDFGMLQMADGVYQLTNWNKRQYASDNSYERVKKHRERAKNLPKLDQNGHCNGTNNASETLQKRYSNVTVTPPDTDTDTDLINNNNIDEADEKEAIRIIRNAYDAAGIMLSRTHIDAHLETIKRHGLTAWQLGFAAALNAGKASFPNYVARCTETAAAQQRRTVQPSGNQSQPILRINFDPTTIRAEDVL